MPGFTEELALYLKGSGIAGIDVYAETIPAAKTASPQLVAVVPSGETISPVNRQRGEHIKRILVTGTAKSSIGKAREIFNFLTKKDKEPAWGFSTGFKTTSFSVKKVFAQSEPALVSNQSNIFIASFSVRFLISGG